MTNDAAQRRSWTFYEAVSSLVLKFVLFVAKYFAKQIYKDVWALRFIVQGCLLNGYKKILPSLLSLNIF